MTDPNRSIIEEFRANQGRVGGSFAGSALLLLHTTGAKTGRPHICPVMYLADRHRYVVFASNAGGPHHPAWYHNLLTEPRVTIEVGATTQARLATVAVGDERETLWARQKEAEPRFAEYERATARTTPVVVLTELVE